MNILIVEDNAPDFLRIKNILSYEDEESLPEIEKSYVLTRVVNKEQAEKILREKVNHFALAIIDVRLDESDPGNKDGLSIARRILSSRTDSFPVIVMTNHYDDEEYTYEAESLGINLRYFISKDSFRRNPRVFVKRIDDAIDNFGIDSMTALEFIANRDRKIGIQGELGSEYKFFGRNEILYFTTLENTKTKVQMTNGTCYVRSYNLGYFVTRIGNTFHNFIRIDQSYLINTELIKSIEGETLTFITNDHIRLSQAALRRLRRSHLII